MAFTLASNTAGQAVPFTLGFAFRKGDVPAGQLLVPSTGSLQVTPKNRWPDGSLKFAVLAGRAPLAAATPLTITLTPGANAGATALGLSDLKSTGLTAAIGCGSLGSVGWSGNDWDSPFQNWISGPQMSSWVYRKPVGTDMHLVAWLEVRLYAGGAVEVLPWIENGYLRVASPSNRSATYTFSLGGTQRESLTIDLKNHQRTPLLSGSRLSHWLASDPDVTIKHDVAYMQATRLVPTYRGTVLASSGAVTQQPASFAPLQQGSFPSGMGAAGYHPSIGVLPQWDAAYLTSNASTLWAAVQRQGYSAGRYGIHFRDETTNQPAKLSSYPNLVLNGSSGIAATGSSTRATETPGATGGSPPSFYTSHHPSMGYLAYLLTGWQYHLETVQFVAVANGFKQSDNTRGFTQGIIKPNAGANTTRGAGWALRSLAQAATISPDGDPMQAELLAQVSANVDYFHARYVAQTNNPLGWVTPYSDYSTADFYGNAQAGSSAASVVLGSSASAVDGAYTGKYASIAKHGSGTGGQKRLITGYVGATRTLTLESPFTFEAGNTMPGRDVAVGDGHVREAWWMQDFVTAAWGYMLAMAPNVSDASRTKMNAFFQWKARSIVSRFGGAQDTDFLARDAAQYEGPVAPVDLPDFDTGRGPWYQSAGEMYAATFSNSPGARVDGDLRGGNFPAASSYWGNLQPALAYAVEHGVSGADVAYRRMVGAGNWPSLSGSLSQNPEWAVRPPVEP
jgi:hypothetical protein